MNLASNSHRNPANAGSLLRVAWWDELEGASPWPDDDGWRPKGVKCHFNSDHITHPPIGRGHTIPFGTKGLLVIAWDVFANETEVWYKVLFKEKIVWIYSGSTVVEKRVP